MDDDRNFAVGRLAPEHLGGDEHGMVFLTGTVTFRDDVGHMNNRAGLHAGDRD